MSVREKFDPAEWIEEAAAGIVRSVRPENTDSLLGMLKEFGIVLPLGRLVSIEPQSESAPAFVEEAIARAELTRAACLQELDSALFTLLAAKIPALVHGVGAAFLMADGSDLEVSECEIWVPEAHQIDALRLLGKAGYRAIEPYATQLSVGEETVLQSGTGAPKLRVRRAGDAWMHAVPGRLKNLPRPVLSPSATELVFYLMKGFAALDCDSLRLLLATRSILQSSLRAEVDWVQLAKSLAQADVLGRAIPGFFALSQQWGVALEGPVQGLVEARRRGLSGELLRSWFSPRELLRPQVPQLRRILGRFTALR